LDSTMGMVARVSLTGDCIATWTVVGMVARV